MASWPWWVIASLGAHECPGRESMHCPLRMWALVLSVHVTLGSDVLTAAGVFAASYGSRREERWLGHLRAGTREFKL